MSVTRIRFFSLMTTAAVALAACEPVGLPTSPTPEPRPAPAPAPAVSQPSAASMAMRDYYARVQQNYLTQGLLRTDGGGPDTPLSRRQLVDNFIKIALYEEFSSVGGQLVRRQAPTRLHRWAGPVRMSVQFGSSVPKEQRDQDRQSVADFSQRLSRLTGLQITMTDVRPNYFVFFVNEDERRKIGPALRAISPDIDTNAVETVQNLRRSTLCLVFALDGDEDGIYDQAVAVIRAEHPDLLRLSCIHEELPQGLGLPNDSPAARPSVFNDDEEFGLLTTQDEFLLRMLYDRRMRPGMTATEARPVAEVIAAELLAGES